MSLDPVINFGKVQVSTGYDASATSVILVSGNGAKLPSTFSYNLVWWNFTDYYDPSDDPDREVVRCTGRSTDTLTILRAQEGTSATAKNISGKTYKMILAPTKKMVDDIDTITKTEHNPDGTQKGFAVSGTNTYTVTRGVTALTDKQAFNGVFANASTGASTLDSDTLGAKKLYVEVNGVYTQVASNDIFAGQHASITYDSSLDGAVGGWVIRNKFQHFSSNKFYGTGFIATDFTQNAGVQASAWVLGIIASGTITAQTGSSAHPGVQRISSSTTTNSGYSYLMNTSVFLLAGQEESNYIFNLTTSALTIVKMGFHDSTTSSLPVDGAYINITTTTLSGKTTNNSTASTTGTSYTLTVGTWYRCKIVVNSNATRVDYYLYAENGTLLWTDYLLTNIPTTAGRECGHGIVATNSGTVALGLIEIDYMDCYIPRVLVR